MYIPLISSSRVYRRKGGGAGGGHGGGRGGGRSSGSGSKGSGHSRVPLSGSSRPGGRSTATAYGGGGGPVSIIPSGQLFAGRSQGGGKRSAIFGTRAYGSGYPGVSTRGVAGRGFPFFFWPVVWGSGVGVATTAYLHSDEYGLASNSSRPGGSMAQAAFISGSSNTTFHVLADNTTVNSLISSVRKNCTSSLSGSSSSSAIAFDPNAANAPQPEQVIQYYRASSSALTLDGYNNTATFSANENEPNTPLPSDIDTKLMDCLNQTIGASVPLIDVAHTMYTGPSVGFMGILWVFWCLSSLVI